ncbi:Tat proofreading chaperone DmsD [Hafnia alvei]|uniref:Tat proofreading chaperone DmsD n=1 Tax=Hafnia alvei TaxID=569 RepID=A0A1C6Z282_HAFAL|nr:Tat proofreading chaperone DmsD [Hafnia alvei]NLS56446.1 Tat proofreading chaperone DmsD [Hafnia alvei]SCM53246.1 chaperone TorD involved in molybdoenzyme TorA maturation [Hafnia alvei]
MLQPQQLQDIAISARSLGALFYYPPESEACTPLVEILSSSEWRSEWPYGSEQQLEQCVALLTTATNEPLEDAYQRLFIGPHALPAPPWGSVYLDKESVLFGDSTLALRQWMRLHHIEGQSEQQEPEDQFGLMLMMAAWLAETQPQALGEFLSVHLLPWSSRYLTLMIQDAQHPFYQGLAELALLTLSAWQQQLAIVPAVSELYR